MARNKLSDLNNHLFAQLERLEDEDMTQKRLEIEIDRSKAISGIAKNIIANAKVTLEAVKLASKELPSPNDLPKQFLEA